MDYAYDYLKLSKKNIYFLKRKRNIDLKAIKYCAW